MNNLEVERKYRITQDFALNFDLEKEASISVDIYLDRGESAFTRIRSNSCGLKCISSKRKISSSNETRKELDQHVSKHDLSAAVGHALLNDKIVAVLGSIVLITKNSLLMDNGETVGICLSAYSIKGEWFAEIEIDKECLSYMSEEDIQETFSKAENKFSLTNREHKSLYELFVLKDTSKMPIKAPKWNYEGNSL